MKNKLLVALAVIGMSLMGPVQAVQLLEFDGSYTADLQLHQYEFENLSENNVSIWMDTLQDGLDSQGTLFKKDGVSGAWDWYGVAIYNGFESAYDSLLEHNPTGKNDFGVALKNGYIFEDPDNQGVSDTGITINSLEVGKYLFVVSENVYQARAQKALGGTLDDGFYTRRGGRWSNWEFNTNGVASPFKVFVEGDVANVSAVPVPAAIWMFASALTGLGFSSRRKKA